ncbi:MAG TPA: deoxyhypusine synthase family protein, partial [Polyangiaceae bacterium]|nr:deoxyhypusine synthase family protein [Polyangiaceae bacterium]
LQGEPLLDQILGVPTQGFDIDVQFCVDPVDNGALSSCPAGEGHTWGKVSAESAERGSVYVHADVTAVFPWLTHALLSDPALKRPHARLIDHFGASVNELQRQVDKRRNSLSSTLRFPLGEAATQAEGGERPAKGGRAAKAGQGAKAGQTAKAGQAPKAGQAAKAGQTAKAGRAAKGARADKAAMAPRGDEKATRRPKRPGARAGR